MIQTPTTEIPINMQLIQTSQDMSNKDFTQMMLDEWRDSDVIKDMKTANEYFLVRNKSIKEKQRQYKDERGTVHTNDTLSNVQIPSEFLRTSVLQKVNYALAKPFLISVESVDKTPEQQKDDTIAEEYLTEWKKFIDDKFLKTLKRVAKDAINCGIGWVYIWIYNHPTDENHKDNGLLKIIDVAADSIYPHWEDRAHTNLDSVIRDFEVTEFKDNDIEIVAKVEYWDATTVERYVDKEGELEIDVSAEELAELPAATAHMTRQTRNEEGELTTEGLVWGKVPFIPLKSNEDELPLLNIIKDMIDAFDRLLSKSVDTMDDDIDPVLIFRNISSQMSTLIKAREQLKESRIAAVDEGGDAYYLQVKADIQANLQLLEFLHKAIYRASATVDPQDVKFGSNPSGIALKSMYQALDIVIEGLETEFKLWMENIKYFFDRWLEFRGIGTVEQWEQYKIVVSLNKDMMINEESLIASTAVLMNTGVSQETIDSYNPAVESYEIEEARREAEYEKAMERQREQSELVQLQRVLEEEQAVRQNNQENI